MDGKPKSEACEPPNPQIETIIHNWENISPHEALCTCLQDMCVTADTFVLSS